MKNFTFFRNTKGAISKWFFTVLAIFSLSTVNAQLVSTYLFSMVNPIAPVNISATGTAVATGNDDSSFGTFPIGFNFTYHGVVFTTFGLNANGFIQLGALPGSSYSPLTAIPNCVSLMGCDLYGLAAGNYIRYQTTGVTPNRVTRVQWTNWGKYSSGLNEFTAQIQLFETSNVVAITYFAAPGVTTFTAQVGLTGAAVTDFNDRTTTTSWAASTLGASNAVTMTFSSAVKPAANLSYVWTPPALPLPTVSSFTPSSGCSGQVVTITGTNFTGATAVRFGGTNAASFIVVNSTTITAVTGAGTTGTIAVVTPSGTGTSAATYTFNTPPANPTSITATPSTVCANTTSNLNAVSAAGYVNWWNAATGGTLIGTSVSAVNFPVTPAVTTTYYAEAVFGSMGTITQTFNYTGALQTWTVPAGVFSITVDLQGAQGGANTLSTGGLGGRTQATYAVTPGQVLNIYVGGNTVAILGGYNGGGNGANISYNRGGGGASDIRIGGTALTDRKLVAGGGGGAGYNCSSAQEWGGAGGGLIGGGGWQCNTQNTYATGGSQAAGGLNIGGLGTNGALGIGGNCTSTYGGGGGGGYYGGGGASYGGGGAGSSYTNPSATGVVHTQGYRAGNGIVTISYPGIVTSCPSSRVAVTVTVVPAPVITVQPVAPSMMCGAQVATMSITATGATTYQWYKNAIALTNTAPYSGVTTSVLTISGPSILENGAVITCVVGNSTGCLTTSTTSILNVGGAGPALPTAVTATPSSICVGQTSNLNATTSTGLIYWWSAAVGGTLLGTSASLGNFPVSPTVNTTYYAEVNTSTAGNLTFNYTGGLQTWTVPAGVTSITVDVQGAQGGAALSTGALGGRVQATYPVTPGQVLNIYVGGTTTAILGGYNGGGNGINISYNRGGGGATDIRIGGTALTDRKLVAGGGGGSGYNCASAQEWGGQGGGTTGQDGWQCNTQVTYVGMGGTPTAGGANLGGLGTAGTLGIGGNCTGTFGGGGGGGYYGGGAASYGGGGGGSNYADPSATGVAHTRGYRTGNGLVTISYNVAGCPSATRVPVTVTINLSGSPLPTPVTATPSSICVGQTSNLNAAASAGTVYWWSAATGGTLFGSSASLVNFPVTPAVTTTYYVEAAASISGTQSFSYTGGAQTWTVPAGVTSLTVDLQGAQGGAALSTGALGGRVQATYPVTPGQVLNIYVGGTTTTVTGGFNGGGNGINISYNRGGGGATDIRIGGTALTDRKLVAGGGGGSGYNCASTQEWGGAGGGLTGAGGWQCNTQNTYATGGSQITGGLNVGGLGTNGALGVGGSCTNTYGGGGGGGYYGGGGASYGGGGGGSSYTDPTATGVVHTQGFRTGDGVVVLSWNGAACISATRVPVTVTVTPTPVITVQPVAPSLMCGAQVATMSITATGATTYQWYKNAVALTNTPPYSGVTTSVLTISGPSILENGAIITCVVSSSGCNATSTTSILAVGGAGPALPSPVTATPSSICTGQTSDLNGTTSTGIINWWDAAVGGTLLGTSVSAANYTVTPAATTTYYAEVNTSAAGTQTFNYSGSIVNWTVPANVTSVTINAKGAQGGQYGAANPGGLGANVSGVFSVTPGQVLSILVGQQPPPNLSVMPGGGGGSYVALGASYTTATPMLVAGGGGGSYSGGFGQGGQITNITTSGDGGGPIPGTNGNGAAGTTCGGGGGGFYTSGGNDLTYGTAGAGGFGFRQGGAGGVSTSGYQTGGFGGGATADYVGACNTTAGSGGGYGGGSGQNSGAGIPSGWGGGSYNGGTSQTNLAGNNSGNGVVTLTWNVAGCPSASRVPVTVTVNPTPVITVQPVAPLMMCGAQVATMSITATGGLTYQWYKNAIALTNTPPYSGVTTSVLTISGPSILENGAVITCVVSNSGCTVTSTTSILSVGGANPALPTPVTATPSSICTGQTSNLNGTASSGTVFWWNAAVGGTLLGTSASLVNYPVTPAVTTTYYAESNTTTPLTQTFNYTGGSQTWTVPAGVTSIAVNSYGAQGGGPNGGLGGNATATVPVTPGSTLYIYVGGQPTVRPGAGSGGFNGGGAVGALPCGGGTSDGWGGGGASDIRTSVSLANRLVVAGGGGGTGYSNGLGGAGGGLTGGDGAASWISGTQGFGGTQSAGGAGGFYSPNSSPSGVLGVGGDAGPLNTYCIGGGGGGGYYGGGGGYVSAGAGGSSYISFPGSTATSTTSGVQLGNGQVIISYNSPGCSSVTRVPVTITVNPTPSITAQPVTPLAICAGNGVITLSVAATNAASYQWYNGATLLTNAAPYSGVTTATLTITNPLVALNANSFTCVVSNGGCTATSSAVVITVNGSAATPTPVTATPATICPGSTSQLNATGSNTINWWDAPTGGTLLGTSVSAANYPVTPAVTTTYYAETQGTNIVTSGTQSFIYTGASQTWTVPAGVTSINVDVIGAKGGDGVNASVGGNGGRVQGTIAVTPGSVLTINVGGAGFNCATCANGGFNGGAGTIAGAGQEAGTGGGASDIRLSPNAYANRIFVAGGGGGGGYTGSTANGGAGGTLTGGTGATWNGYPGGTGGTQVGGGIGGVGTPWSQPSAINGSLGLGGSGQGWSGGGGGGGGGYFGGGGGFIGGGGGGSNYADPSASAVTHTQGYQSGNGQVTISWNINLVGCASPTRTPVTVTVDTPTPVTATGATICYGANALLSAGTNSNWYTVPSAGSPIGTGITYPTPSLTTTTTYYIESVSPSGCISAPPRTAVTATVNPFPATIMPITGPATGCNVVSPNNWVYMVSTSNDIVACIYDSSAFNNLGVTSGDVLINGTVQFFNGYPYMQRVVTLTPTSNGPAMVRLFYTQQEFNNLQAVDPLLLLHTDLGVTKFTGPGLVGTEVFIQPVNYRTPAQTGMANVYSLDVPVSGFSTFTIHTNINNTPLPISLVSFTGNCLDGTAELFWKTESENNNDYFSVIKSEDGGANFSVVDTVDGAGTSSMPHYYHWKDENSSSPAYYKIRQTDFNGQQEDFNFIYLACDGNSRNTFSVYPNPTVGIFTISFPSTTDGKLSISLCNMQGKQIMNSQTNVQAGTNSMSFDATTLSPGTYMISFNVNGIVYHSRLVKTD